MDTKMAKQEILKGGPIVMAFKVFSDFMSYKSGIYYPMSTKVTGMHGVGILGFGPSHFSGVNSWGSNWGERGFFKMREGCCEQMFMVSDAPSQQRNAFGSSTSRRRSYSKAPTCNCKERNQKFFCCGDGVCQSGDEGPESPLTCPFDCASSLAHESSKISSSMVLNDISRSIHPANMDNEQLSNVLSP